MAQSTAENSEMTYPDERDAGGRDFDVQADQIEHLNRILDLQVEGSRKVYDNALRLLVLDSGLVAALVLSAAIVFGVAGFDPLAEGRIGLMLLAFGLGALFVSIAFAVEAYLGSVANYGKVVTADDPAEYKQKHISRNIRIVEDNVEAMEAKVGTLRKALASLVAGLAGFALGFGFLLVPLETGTQFGIIMAAFVVIGYLVNHVLGEPFIQGERFTR